MNSTFIYRKWSMLWE